MIIRTSSSSRSLEDSAVRARGVCVLFVCECVCCFFFCDTRSARSTRCFAHNQMGVDVHACVRATDDAAPCPCVCFQHMAAIIKAPISRAPRSWRNDDFRKRIIPLVCCNKKLPPVLELTMRTRNKIVRISPNNKPTAPYIRVHVRAILSVLDNHRRTPSKVVRNECVCVLQMYTQTLFGQTKNTCPTTIIR